MFVRSKLVALIAATTLLTLGATSAWADVVYNDLDATIDSAYESMSLTYETGTSIGSSRTTTLAIQIDGMPAGDHPGCNIQGGAHYITIAPTFSVATVATVELSNSGRFDTCTDTVLATVTAQGVGTTDVTFEIVDERTSGDPHLTFSLAEAAFTVTVVEGTTVGNPGTVCDADPAAPAWASAILKANGYKANSGAAKNYISQVAGAMSQRAEFGTYAKNAHPQYENAVLDFLKIQTRNDGLVMGARPGWVCTSAG
jgi:hypothetical protein